MKNIHPLLRFIYIVFFSVYVSLSMASINLYQFENSQQEQDFKTLTFELRCLVCQNQNLADSNAELAEDLKKQVYTMLVNENKSKDEIVNFMVQRYGDFVMYKPPVKNTTYFLWIGPLLFLIIGFWLVIKVIKNAARQNNSGKEES
jgi:cytochrome c-type biogenesis protein CcmH